LGAFFFDVEGAAEGVGVADAVFALSPGVAEGEDEAWDDEAEVGEGLAALAHVGGGDKFAAVETAETGEKLADTGKVGGSAFGFFEEPGVAVAAEVDRIVAPADADVGEAIDVGVEGLAEILAFLGGGDLVAFVEIDPAAEGGDEEEEEEGAGGFHVRSGVG
jgi:hypothetical protein